MRILRTIKGVILRDRIRSQDIREELGDQDMVRWVRTHKRFWRDHVERIQDTRWAKTQKPDTSRAIGRPPK